MPWEILEDIVEKNPWVIPGKTALEEFLEKLFIKIYIFSERKFLFKEKPWKMSRETFELL